MVESFEAQRGAFNHSAPEHLASRPEKAISFELEALAYELER